MSQNTDIAILYVEDQDDVRLFLSKILSRHYKTVYIAENGKLGLELYKTHKPDIIISDIKMPVMDGLSMSSRIKEINPSAKIILTTAHSDMEYFMQSIDIGINQYILKPIDRDKLYSAIDTCVGQVKMEREVLKKSNDLNRSHEKLIERERELRESLQKTIALKEIVSTSEENFRQLADNIEEVFWLQTPEKILYVNNAFEKIFEFPSKEFYDDAKYVLSYIHPDDKDDFVRDLREHENNQKGFFQKEVRIITPQNEEKHIWYKDSYVTLKDKKEIRRAITVSDISRHKENERLQRELEMAGKMVKVKQQFLSNISHEMRTPLNGIMAMTDVLLQTPLNEDQLDFALTVKNSGENLLSLINDLLSLSLLEEGKLSLKPKPFDLQLSIKSLLKGFEPAIEKKSLKLDFSFSEIFPSCFIADEKRVNQVLHNLISNAIKFTSKGFIKVACDIKSTNESLSTLQIAIQDSGIGIPEDFQKQLFHIFTQYDDSITRSYEGLGLGLTISSRIAKLMDGNIELTRSDENGSTFTFTFKGKVCQQKENHQQSGTLIGTKPSLNAKVLYAEDKEVNQKVVKIILGNTGCTVDIAENGLEALEMFEQKKYDIILMDIQMPKMDGITATQKLREKHQTLPPIIGISANAQEGDAEYYIAEGLDDYMSKPIDPNSLIRKISKWLHPEKMVSQNNEPAASKVNKDANLKQINLQIIKQLEEQTGGDTNLIRDLFESFIKEADGLLKQMEESIKGNDTKSLKTQTHTLKGLASAVGAEIIYDLAEKMDKNHKLNEFNKSVELFSSLIKEYEEVKPRVIEMFKLNL